MEQCRARYLRGFPNYLFTSVVWLVGEGGERKKKEYGRGRRKGDGKEREMGGGRMCSVGKREMEKESEGKGRMIAN